MIDQALMREGDRGERGRLGRERGREAEKKRQ